MWSCILQNADGTTKSFLGCGSSSLCAGALNLSQTLLFLSASLLWELEDVIWMWRAELRSAAPWLSPHPSYTRSPALNMSQHIWNVEPPHHTVPDSPQSLLPGARQEIDGPKDFEAARAIRFNNDMMCPDGHIFAACWGSESLSVVALSLGLSSLWRVGHCVVWRFDIPDVLAHV